MRWSQCCLLVIAGTAAVACSKGAYSPTQLAGVWRHEATVSSGFGSATERLNLKLDADGKVAVASTVGNSELDKLEGTWKCADDYLVMTRPDSSFGVFRIVAVDAAEMRVLTRTGKLYRLTKMPE